MELKPGYKQTEVGVIPEDWDCVHIGDVAETSSGATPSRAKQQEYFDRGTIPWAKTLDLNNSSILETDECVTPSALQQTSLRLYPSGSVLVAMYGGFNQIWRTGMLTKDATINQALTAIRPDKTRLSSRFLLNYLNFRVEYWKSVASSSRKDPNITGKDVREFAIALPPLREQEATCDALQDIEDQISMLDMLTDKKADIKQAAMQELLTGKRRLPGFEGEWELKRLGEHVKFLRNGVNSRAELHSEGSIKYLHYGDIHANADSFLSPQHLPCLLGAKAARLDRLRSGDLIFADASEDIAGVSKSVEILGACESEVVSGLHTIAARFDKAVLADGFKGFLQYVPSFSAHLRRLAAGTKVYATNRSHISSAEVRLPPVAEQKAVADVLMDMSNEIGLLRERMKKACSTKQGMMQELLTGKIRLT